MDRTNPMQIRVIAAVLSREDQLLVCQRPENKRHGTLWEFPGGKVEPGESDEQAVRRELLEELGLELESIGEAELEIADPGSPFLITFTPVRATGDPVCYEHAALAWGTPAELARLPLAPSDRRYVEFIMARSEA
jgi:mutator protein MutT